MDLPTLNVNTEFIIEALVAAYINQQLPTDSTDAYWLRLSADTKKLRIYFLKPLDFLGMDWAPLPGLLNGEQDDYTFSPVDDDYNEWMNERHAYRANTVWATSLPLNKKVAN
jgi:hypothetical protein